MRKINYFLLIFYTCIDCEPKCSSCENSANSCTICSPSLTRKNEAPNCPCMEGFFEPSLAE